ncbi:MAG: ATP-binding protein [Candidatus Sumerlaeia bacterium]|nr:ATP-binding protein [Candidatus Sumerlaeia bacterium]
MPERWAALVHLPPDAAHRLAAFLEEKGVCPHIRRWETAGAQWPSTPPELVVCPAETYAAHRDCLPWLNNVPPARVVLVSQALPLSDTLQLCLARNLVNVVPLALWEKPECFGRLFAALLEPQVAFNIRHWSPDSKPEQFAVTSLADKQQIIENVTALVREQSAGVGQTRDIRLVVAELINNALFHSFRNGEGGEKYSPRQFSGLCAPDTVRVEAAVDRNSAVVAVEDNAGTLQPAEVLHHLHRQTTGEGVYDSHGRGLYLVYQLADHLNVCVAPRRRTQIVAVVHAAETPPPTLAFFVCE